ncbi:MAG: sensor histidine kinase [Halothece sp.]
MVNGVGYLAVILFMRGQDGTVKQIAGTAEDITGRKQAEEKIQASLEEKEVLLKEVHHRVKNNLNVIYSLLNMQSRVVTDSEIKNLLLDSQRRIQTMGLIHEQLYQSNSLSQINFCDYINRLANNLYASANLDADRVKLEIEAEPVALNLQTAIPSGLIINELLTNAFKYAFEDGRSGVIRIEFYQSSNQKLNLIVSDNGVGLPSDYNQNKTASLGMRLVKILAQQLRANFGIDSSSQGSRFELSYFPITD